MQDRTSIDLLKHPKLWRGSTRQSSASDAQDIPTGYPSITENLPGNGWPAGALTEIVSDGVGVGELRLVMPALAHLTCQGRWLAWIAPPYIPYAPALEQYGAVLSRIVVVQTTSVTESLWAAEQILRNRNTGAVLLWSYPADDRKLRRLQLAAEVGSSWGVLFARTSSPSSPAALRLCLSPSSPDSGGASMVRVLKCRGGAPGTFLWKE